MRKISFVWLSVALLTQVLALVIRCYNRSKKDIIRNTKIYRGSVSPCFGITYYYQTSFLGQLKVFMRQLTECFATRGQLISIVLPNCKIAKSCIYHLFLEQTLNIFGSFQTSFMSRIDSVLLFLFDQSLNRSGGIFPPESF